MGLSRQSLSPAATLLRNSRLFSLPNPLPRPQVGESFGGGIIKASDTATLPYPTHQAIITTPSSLARGDWGLKRALPNKSSLLQVSNPVLRITQLDTIEHVTDYDSAADHVRTREKWEAMGTPMMRGLSLITRDVDLSGLGPSGAFELRDDTTSYTTELGLDEGGLWLQALKKSAVKSAESKRSRVQKLHREWRHAQQRLRRARAAGLKEGSIKEAKLTRKVEDAKEAWKNRKQLEAQDSFSPFVRPQANSEAHNARRWKHEGPWLPGMSAKEFVAYVAKEVSKRRPEFHRYLLHWVKSSLYESRRQATLETSSPPLDAASASLWQEEQERKWSTFTEKDIYAAIHRLRTETANDVLSSRLVERLMMPFLRLPPVKFKSKLFAQDARGRDFDQFHVNDEISPLSTHPCAGLGYLRSRSYLHAHPILGPQAQPPPVQARVIQARTTSTGKEAYARFGVGGFVANDPLRTTDKSSALRSNISNAQDVETIDIDTMGGRKVLVHPQFGSVANSGRIMIKLQRAVGSEGLVAKGRLDDRPMMDVGMGQEGGKASDGDGEGSERARAFRDLLQRQSLSQAKSPHTRVQQ